MKFQQLVLLATSSFFVGVSGNDIRKLRFERRLSSVGLGEQCYYPRSFWNWWADLYDCREGSCIDYYCKKETSRDRIKAPLLKEYAQLATWDDEAAIIPESYHQQAGHGQYKIYSTSDGTCHIVFRSTHGVDDIITNVMSQVQGYSDPTGSGIQVNNAFWANYLAMSQDLEGDIQVAKNSGNCSKDWNMYGHSLGGTIADLAVVALAHSEGRPLHNKVASIFRMGSPRPFGESGATCSKFLTLVKGDVQRFARVVSHSHYKDFDAVTAVPFNFHHCSKESFLAFSSDEYGSQDIHIEERVGMDAPNDDLNLLEDFVAWLWSEYQDTESFHEKDGYVRILEHAKVYTRKT